MYEIEVSQYLSAYLSMALKLGKVSKNKLRMGFYHNVVCSLERRVEMYRAGEGKLVN